MAKKPFITTPGTVSRSDGRSGNPGNRWSEVIARRRTLPDWTTALAAAIELIITWLMPPATSWTICAADRYGTSIRSRPARLLNSFAPKAAAPPAGGGGMGRGGGVAV